MTTTVQLQGARANLDEAGVQAEVSDMFNTTLHSRKVHAPNAAQNHGSGLAKHDSLFSQVVHIASPVIFYRVIRRFDVVV